MEQRVPSLRRTVMWAVTYRCNISCGYCYLDAPQTRASRNRREATPDQAISIAHGLVNSTAWRPEVVYLTGGEPTLHCALPDLLRILTDGGIKTVVSTNGVLQRKIADAIVQASPTAVMVSLDLSEPYWNDKVRARTSDVIGTIRYLAEHKPPGTILGAAAVVTKYNAAELASHAHYLASEGVQYMSLNPLHVHTSALEPLLPQFDAEVLETFRRALTEIKEANIVQLPCDLYLELLMSHFSGTPIVHHVCPAAHEYAFIAPWGGVYPCSSEFWHCDKRFLTPPVAASEDFALPLRSLQLSLQGSRFSTSSSCFGTRCMGCWKIYYDGVLGCG